MNYPSDREDYNILKAFIGNKDNKNIKVKNAIKKYLEKYKNAKEDYEFERKMRKALNLENQALYESMNCNDDTMLAVKYKKLQEEKNTLEILLTEEISERQLVKSKYCLLLVRIENKIKDIERELKILDKKQDDSIIYSARDICNAEILRLKEILKEE